MRFLHSMIRVKNLDKTLAFFKLLDIHEIRRTEQEQWKCSLVYLAAKADIQQATDTQAPIIELTYNWDRAEDYSMGESFGHLAFEVDNIHETCEKLMATGVVINRPPRDGWMAFIKTPDGISLELLQKGTRLEPSEPWTTMENIGSW
jgi:lactoylglutathione lyase